MLKNYILEKIIFKKLEEIYNLINNNLNDDLDNNIANIFKILNSKKKYLDFFDLFIFDDSLLTNKHKYKLFSIELSFFQNNKLNTIYSLTNKELDYSLFKNYNNYYIKDIQLTKLFLLNKYLKLFKLEIENKINNDKNEILNYFNF